MTEELLALGFEEELERLGERCGVVDTFDLDQLTAAGLTNKVVFDLRRRFDPEEKARRAVADEALVRGDMPNVNNTRNGLIRCDCLGLSFLNSFNLPRHWHHSRSRLTNSGVWKQNVCKRHWQKSSVKVSKPLRPGVSL